MMNFVFITSFPCFGIVLPYVYVGIPLKVWLIFELYKNSTVLHTDFRDLNQYIIYKTVYYTTVYKSKI